MRLAVFATLALSACALPPIDYEGRPCPCPEGWTCQLGGTCAPLGATVPRETECDGALGAELACSGFEDGVASPFVGLSVGGVVEPAQPGRRGNGAMVSCALEGEGEHAAVLLLAPPPQTPGPETLFVRAWALLQPDRSREVRLLTLAFPEADYGEVVLVRANGELGVQALTSTVSVAPTWTGRSIAGSTWACIQLERTLVPGGGSVTLSLDGVEAYRSSGEAPVTFAAPYQLALGVVGIDLQEPVCLALDDVVVSTSQMPPCE